MATAIIAICAALIPLLVFLVRRYIAQRDDPEQIRHRGQTEIDRAVASGDADTVNRLFSDNLQRLQNKNHRPK